MTDTKIQQAANLLAAGRNADAESLLRKLADDEPNNAEAFHQLGIIAQLSRRTDEAIKLMMRAVQLSPNAARYWLNLGSALSQHGSINDALSCFQRAVALEPNFPEANFNLGSTLKTLNRLDESLPYLRRAAQLAPNMIQAWVMLGIVLYTQGNMVGALEAFVQSARLAPKDPLHFGNMAVVLNSLGRFAESLAASRAAIQLRDNHPDDYNNLGVSLTALGRCEEAVQSFQRALQLRPNYMEAFNNLGNALTELMRLDEAIEAYDKAKAINPAIRDPHFNQAWVYLLQGNFEKGWRGHEYRWGSKNLPTQQKVFPQPQWDGGPIEGKTIFLHAEQGLGDSIHFIRYMPLVAERGARVVVAVHPALLRLFTSVPGISQLISERSTTLPAFDVHSPLLSLPLAFNTRLETIPNKVPYLHAAQELVEQWSRKLGPRNGRLRIGIAWAGDPGNKQDARRSILLKAFAPLASIKNVEFHSLQKGAAAAQIKDPTVGISVIDHNAELNDLADTAALIENLDLTISVDTVVAHLAGAMAKPVWILIPSKPDYRWLLHRQDSPWYPTMRLFRQNKALEWAEVFERVAEALRMKVESAANEKSSPAS